MKSYFKLVIFAICMLIVSCKKENINVMFFKDTKAYDLAKAVEKEDLDKVESLVKKDKKLLEVIDPVSGSNVLSLSLTLENFESFKKLLELGANPNFINPITKRSVLIDACTFYNKPEPYTIDLRYIRLLLEKGANPNYIVENDFTDKEGNYHMATSAIHEASALDLTMVKILIKGGANPYKKLEQNQSPPFSSALKGFKNKFEITNYYIDSLNVDLKEPLGIVNRQPSNELTELYIQDYIDKFFSYEKGTEGYQKTQKLIEKLKSKGVNFNNYQYKM
jgi:ankyrin repeat protein